MKTHPFHPRMGFLAVLLLGSLFQRVGAAESAGDKPRPGASAALPIRVYSHLLDPREHPDYDRRAVKPPSWETFNRQTQFTSLRGLAVEGGKVVGFREEIERYTRTFALGDVLWPSYPILFATNLTELAEEVKQRNLWLFDVWGYVPGSGPGGYWQQFKPPETAWRALELTLGDRWLGADIGEQDGRYVGGYASQMQPSGAGRLEQYLNFQRHFERMGDDLGQRLCGLVSLNFGHYFLKEGTFSLLGAETAQALPNSQVYYAFIRGAGKQYGVPWFGNASIYNRWGYKSYGGSGKSEGYEFGPTKGTSLSLMKRLIYHHILYNSVVVGFENGWFEGDHLSPIGRIQQAAQKWVRDNGPPGVQHTPVALLLDFQSGWSFPRHLYTDRIYRVWGNLPYEPGDHLTDGVLDLVFPGYQNASYFHDESGFLSASPFGDMVDVLLSDAPAWLLSRYAVVVVAGELTGGAEVQEKLLQYAAGGGHLVITAGNLARWPGMTPARPPQRFLAGLNVGLGSRSVREDRPFELYNEPLPEGVRAVAHCGAVPAAVEYDYGKGRVTMFSSPFGVAAEPPKSLELKSDIDKPLASPLPLLAHVRAVLESILKKHRLFEVDPGLSLVTCRRGPGDYVLGITNPSWKPRPLKLISLCGSIESVKEMSLDSSERGAPGWLPESVSAIGIGQSDEATLEGGGLRILAVRVRESGVAEIPHALPPARPKGRYLALRGTRSIKEEVLSRPTFFEHFDGVMVDWRAVHERENSALSRDARWIARQGLRVVVDLGSGLNLYPDLRLLDNLPEEFAASRKVVSEVIEKMALLRARDLVLTLHRHPENNFTDQQSQESFAVALKEICTSAETRGIEVHLRLAPGKPPWSIESGVQWIVRLGLPNLHLAPSTALILAGKSPLADSASVLRGRVGLWMLAAPMVDAAGQLYGANGRLADTPQAASALKLLSLVPGTPVVVDSLCRNVDDEYREVRLLERGGPGDP
jgi:hypothetical protein